MKVDEKEPITNNMQMHNAYADAQKLVEEYLEGNYIEEAQVILKQQGHDFKTKYIYNVKSGFRKNPIVMKVLAGLAQKRKQDLISLAKILKS